MLSMEQESFIIELIENGCDSVDKLIIELQFCKDNQPEYTDFLLSIIDILNNNPNSIQYIFKQ